MYPFAALVSTMQKDELLAIADPKDRELVRFSVGETFDANVKVLQTVVPRPESTGPRDTYIVRRVCQGPPFASWRLGVREGGASPPTWDPLAVVEGDEEGNTFMWEWYCPQVTISSFWDAKENTKKREEHSAMFRGWGRGANPKHFFFGISDVATVKVAEDREERGLPAWANEEVEWEVPCELLLPLAHPLGWAVRKMLWDKGELGDVRVPAHQHAEEVYQRGEHLRLCEWSPDDVADYEERLRYIQGDHVFVGGEGVEGAEEKEGGEAKKEEVEEAEEEEVKETKEEEGGEEKEEEWKAPVDIQPDLTIEVDVDAPPQPPAPRPKPSPKPPARGAVRRKPQPAYKYGGKKELVESASHGTLRKVPDVYYIPGRWVDRRHPLTLRQLGAPRGDPGVGHLYALFFEAHTDGTMHTRVCETGGAGYAEVEYIRTHLGTLFQGVPGCTKMPPVHFWVSPPKRVTKCSVRRNGNRGVARCALLLARIMAHLIKGGHYVPLEDLPGVVTGLEFTTVAEMWGDVAMLAAWGGVMARRPGQRPSGKLGAVCDEVTAMVEARADEPPLVPLSWVGYLALALAGEESLRVPFGCVVPYSLGGRFGEIQKFVSEGRWEKVRTEAKRTGRVQQRVWLAQWVSGGEGRKGVAHKQPKARVGKKRKLTVG